jgi:beta-glucosidase/6-phospho-beta-glucosidase/beta-galactosidase
VSRVFLFVCTGKIGIALNIHWCEPVTNSTEDVAACERYQQFNVSKQFQHLLRSPLLCHFVSVMYLNLYNMQQDMSTFHTIMYIFYMYVLDNDIMRTGEFN